MTQGRISRIQSEQIRPIRPAPAPAGMLRRAAINTARAPEEVPPVVHEVLRTGGRPLEAETRALMEPRFGYDFSQVRVHADARAADSARAVNALAYTVGRDVVFGAGQYAPHTAAGERLVAHELTHVLQQGGQAPTAFSIGPAHDEFEREANVTAQGLHSGGLQAGPTSASPALQRQPTPTDDKKKTQGAKEVTTQPQPQPIPKLEIRKEITLPAAAEKEGLEKTATLSTETEAKRGANQRIGAEATEKFELEVAIPITDRLRLGRLRFAKELSLSPSLSLGAPAVGERPMTSLELETSLKVLSLEWEKVTVPLGVADFGISGSALGSAGYDVVAGKSALKAGFAGEAEAKFKPGGEKSPFYITAKVGVEKTYNRDGTGDFKWGPMTWKGNVGVGYNF
jgi:hypothetical protein